MGNISNIWHIAQNGDVYPVLTAVEKSEAEHVADVMQELSFVGRLPQTFYMVAPIGCDMDWMEMMKENEFSEPPVDYMRVYEEAVREGFQR
jgi:hypothetical protein